MGSFIDLNTLSAGLIPYTDLRGDGIVFDTTTPSSVTETFLGTVYPVPNQMNLLELTKPIDAQLTYTINLTGVDYQSLTWSNLPSSVSLVQTGKVYVISNILSVSDWNAIKNPRLTFAGNTTGSIPTFTVSVSYKTISGTTVTSSWNIALTIASIQIAVTTSMVTDPTYIEATTVFMNTVSSIYASLLRVRPGTVLEVGAFTWNISETWLRLAQGNLNAVSTFTFPQFFTAIKRLVASEIVGTATQSTVANFTTQSALKNKILSVQTVDDFKVNRIPLIEVDVESVTDIVTNTELSRIRDNPATLNANANIVAEPLRIKQLEATVLTAFNSSIDIFRIPGTSSFQPVITEITIDAVKITDITKDLESEIVKVSDINYTANAVSAIATSASITGELTGADFAFTTIDMNTLTVDPTVEFQLFDEISGNNSYTIDWGDGTIETVGEGTHSHTYATKGIETVRIVPDGKFRFRLGDTSRVQKVLSFPLPQVGVFSLETAFLGAAELTQIPDNPFIGLTNCRGAFQACNKFNSPLSSFNANAITDMSDMFNGCGQFKQDISSWNTINVTNMARMFKGCGINTSLDSWNVSKVTDMSNMFELAFNFNSSLNSWDVSSVTNMSGMFKNANNFNSSINSWDVSNVTDMNSMFEGAIQFNQDISSWNTGNVTNMSRMFTIATIFNQPLNTWDVSNVTSMNSMFGSANSFNQPLDAWDVSSVVTMESMFQNAQSFDQDISTWNVIGISSKPFNFDSNTSANWTTAEKPQWGTDPIKVAGSGFRDDRVISTLTVTAD